MDKQVFYNQICEEEQELIQTLEALQLLKKRYETPMSISKKVMTSQTQLFTGGEAIKATTPKITRANSKKTYTPRAGENTVPGKILAVLTAIGKGTSKQVAEKMLEMYPEYQTRGDRASKDAKHHLSKLFINKLIAAEKIPGTKSYMYKSK